MNLKLKNFLIERDKTMIEKLTNSEQTANDTSPLPNTMKLTTTEWRVIITSGEHTRCGKSCAPVAFVPGTLGYARRNEFQPDRIQVVAYTTKGSVGSWYIRETEATSLLATSARISPRQGVVQRAWEAAWAHSF